MNIVAILLSFVVSLGLLWAVQSMVLGQKFELVPSIINIVVVLVVVTAASVITGKVLHKSGVKVAVAK